jgi:hypothetical protein
MIPEAMNRILPLLLFLSVATIQPVAAQQITMSEDIPLRNDVAYELLGEFKGRVLLFRDQISKYEVQGFDQRLRPSWSKILTLDKKNPKVIGSTHSRNDFTLIYHYRDQGNTILKAAKFDPGANMIDSATINNLGSVFFTPEFELAFSEDRSKILVYYIERQSILHAFVFDAASFRPLWKKSVSPSGFSFFEDFLQVVLDNEGNMCLVFEKDKFLARKDGHHYHIISVIGTEDRLTQFQAPLDGKLTYDVLFTYDNLNDRLVAAGLYSDKSGDRATGYFVLKIDPLQRELPFLRFESFNDLFVSNLIGKEVEKNKGVTELSVREIVLRRDGGVLMIAERIREYERRLGAPNRVSFDGVGRFIVDYYHEDIVALSIHPDGRAHWETILPKKQYSQDDGGVYSSYFLFKTPENLRFLFNDEIRFENTVSEYRLNGAGAFERRSLLNTEKLEVRLRFRDAIQVSADALVVPSERRNRLRLVKITFDE